MKYTVVKIEEDIDFGCEEKMKDQTVMAVVTLRSGEDMIQVKQPDQLLYDREINEGDRVKFDEEKFLEKIPVKTVDLMQFVDLMNAARAGEDIEWICPVCDQEISVSYYSDQHIEISCSNCGMKIELTE